MDEVELLFARQYGLARVDQLRALGVGRSAVAHRCRPGGRWQMVLPGVVAGFTGGLNDLQRHQAALLWGGAGALLGGRTAAGLYTLRYLPAPSDRRIHLLLPHGRRREPPPGIALRRSLALPKPYWRSGLAVVPPARAVVDACRTTTSLRAARALAAEALGAGLVRIHELDVELAAGGSAGSQLLRRAVEDLRAGTRSAPEAEFRDLVLAARLPEPLWNHDLYAPDGRRIARPDGWWPEGVAWESDSQEWHGSDPDRWERTLRRNERLAEWGVVVVAASPTRIRTAGGELIRTVAAALASARWHPAPPLRAVPAGSPPPQQP